MATRERDQERRPLRIAFVTPEPNPGGGVPGMAVLLARGLAALGHEVDCWTAAESRRDPAWADVPGLTLHVVEGWFRWGRWYSRRTRPVTTSFAQVASRARANPSLVRGLLAAHRVTPYDVVYRFSTVELLGFGRHLKSLPAFVLHPEVHAAGEQRWTLAEVALARRCHSIGQRAIVRAYLALRVRLQRRDIRRVSAVIAPSHRFAELVGQDYGVPPERFVVVPNPVDLDVFHPRLRPTDGSRSKVRITYVGRAAVRKGIDQLVALSHRLDDLAEVVELQVVASASLWSDYRPLLADLNPRVAMVVPQMGNREVAELVAQSDLLVQPSKYEPFAITVAEALASGTPVIVTDEVGAGEGLDPRCATVVPAGDVGALEQAVRARVAEIRAGDQREARASARAEAERCFAPEVVCRAVADALAHAAALPRREVGA